MQKLLNKRTPILRGIGQVSLGAFGFSELSQFGNNFLSTTNLAYIESLYLQWQNDKDSVSKSYQSYFELLERG